MNKRKFFNKLKLDFNKIHLVDKYLILFMVVLMVQSAFSLFAQGQLSAEAGDIDIIVRTSAAAIFGYFLSANFVNRSIKKGGGNEDNDSGARRVTTNRNLTASTDGEDSTIKNKMGFAIPGVESNQEDGGIHEYSDDADEPEEAEELTSQLQIVIAATIGLFCLIVLIFLRDVAAQNMAGDSTSSSMATVTQFRDFVSGCVGFLIGCPTSGQKK